MNLTGATPSTEELVKLSSGPQRLSQTRFTTARRSLIKALSRLSVPKEAIKREDDHIKIMHDIHPSRAAKLKEIVAATNVRGIEVRWHDTCIREARVPKPPKERKKGRRKPKMSRAAKISAAAKTTT